MSDFYERISNLSPKRLMLLALELQNKVEALEAAKHEPIAIVGMGCRFPGGANSPEAYWELMKNGVDAIQDVPAERWHNDPSQRGGFMDPIDRFDAAFFGISPREAALMDPQQRIVLEVAWEALERAGYAPDSLGGSSTGVFLGICNNDYFQMMASGDALDMYVATGSAHSVVAGRISYLLGLEGPAIAFDTACSSSLVAIHVACQSLRSGECRMALAGGVNAVLAPQVTLALSDMMAPDARSKAFDARADGFVRSEGCGVIVLKRLSDALADGDNVLAVIRGSAANQDGRSNGLTAPNGPSQVSVIREALANSQVEPQDVSYVEAHGTGTPLGDPIEVQALGAALGPGRPAESPLFIGSVKVNVGHMEAAAGIGGLMKLVLMMQHQQIPPHLHLTALNPYIPWDELPIRISTDLIPWQAERRIAGVSSFGFSGTNVHIILEEAPTTEAIAADIERPAHVLTLSARSEKALRELAERWRDYLVANPAVSLGDVAYSANSGRGQFNYRLALTVRSVDDAVKALDSFTPGVVGELGDVAFIFTGHGSQYVDMGRELYETQPVFREAFDQGAALFASYIDVPLHQVVFDADGSLLNNMAYAQPVLFTLQYALAQMWLAWGIRPATVLGHSLGEYVAAVIAGVFSLEDGVKLVAARSRLMQSLPGGEMVAVFADENRVAAAIEPFKNQVAIAVINGAENLVISGATEAVAGVLERLKADKIKYRKLDVAQASHSPQLDPMLDEFEAVAATIDYSQPNITYVSCLTANAVTDVSSAAYWRRHIRHTVRFADAMQALYDIGARTFVEIGPSPTLTALAQRFLNASDALWLPTLRENVAPWQQTLDSLGKWYVAGGTVDWQAFEAPYARRKLIAPTYPFQRERYWLPKTSQGIKRQPGGHPFLGRALRSPALEGVVYETEFATDNPAFLSDHRILGVVLLPAPVYIEWALAAAKDAFGDQVYRLENFAIYESLVLAEGSTRTAQIILTPAEGGLSSFQILSLVDGDWKLHATGSVRAAAEVPTNTITASAIQARSVEDLTGASYYDHLYDMGMEFGAKFRGVDHLWRGDNEVLGLVRLADDLNETSYPIHPALLDACFHVIGALVLLGDVAYLMIGLESLRVYRAAGKQVWCHVTLQPGSTPGAEVFSCDVRLYDEAGQLIGEIGGAQLKRAGRDALVQATQQRLDDWFYQIDWQAKALPADEKRIEPANWLIFTDNRGVGGSLADLLTQRGEIALLVSPGDSFAKITPTHWQIDPYSSDDYRRLWREVQSYNRRLCRGVVHLWSTELATPTEAMSAADIQAAALAGTTSALLLAQALTPGSEKITTLKLWLITQGARAANITQTPVHGLARGISLEHPEIWGGLVDLDSRIPPRANATHVLNELWRADDEDYIAYEGDERLVARLVRSQAPNHQPLTLRSDATYLVTGGLGGLGLKIGQWLAEQGAQHIVLVGRRGLAEGDPRLATLAAMENAGAQVTVIAADMSDESQAAEVVGQFRDSLRGVIHAAADLSNWLINDLNTDALSAMLAPKVAGTWALHQATRDLPLDFFVLFSSTTALWGSKFLGHYAAANQFLDAFAHYRRQLGLPVLSVNWGAWDAMRVATQADQDSVAQSGLNLMNSAQALSILGDLLMDANQPTQAVVASVDWDSLKAVYEARRSRPLFEQVANTRRTRVKPAQNFDLIERLREATPADRREMLLAYIQGEVARTLRIEQPEMVDVHQGLFDMGMDSLMSVELKNCLEAGVQQPLPSTLTFNYPTVSHLADYLENHVIAFETEPTPEVVEIVADEPTPTAEVDDLSEDDLANLLAKRLGSINRSKF